ncbi:Cell division control protein 7, variant 3 [Entomophthora muscae]|uniref:Cell division control protein 7, variant 3 n=1 Tax=Entomophthora muscae TaxID=34485 RepID=A0ACC2SMW0_9FUNG|nr:Cell division control protein 7, variant 3 [Entomophthora muscae]
MADNPEDALRERMRATRDERDLQATARGGATSHGTFLLPPMPLQPPAFDQFPNSSYMFNSRLGVPSSYTGLMPNTSRFAQSPGVLPLHPPSSFNPYSTAHYTMAGGQHPGAQMSTLGPAYNTQAARVASQPSTSRLGSSYLTSEPHASNTPALVVNDAYLNHLRRRFPVVLAHRKEIEALSRLFPNLDHEYYLYDKIGEGTFSSVYKGIDVKHDLYENSGWDLYPSASDSEDDETGPPPPPALIWESDEAGSRSIISSDPTAHPRPAPPLPTRRGPHYKFVAVKKIYVTSSCQRIENEIEILHTLSGHPNIVGLITALRREDQIIVVTPYYRHHDFRETFSLFNYEDMRNYMRCLLKGLSFCHLHHIIHRDVKPSNFLYHLNRRRGQLADFGLAQRQDLPSSSKRHHPPPTSSFHEVDTSIQNDSFARPAPNGVPFSYIDENGIPGVVRNELRPTIRANRAGTRGFRAPEVLLKVIHQTTAIDIWSAGVILLCMLSRRFPFFNSPNDQDALIEIGIIFGSIRMQEAAASFGNSIPCQANHFRKNVFNKCTKRYSTGNDI